MKFGEVKSYISKDETIKKEILVEGAYCIFTDKKVYRGNIGSDNSVDLHVDDITSFKNIDYKKTVIDEVQKSPAGGAFIAAGVASLLAAIIMVLSGLTIFILFLLAGAIFLSVGLMLLNGISKSKNNALLIINFTDDKFVISANNLSEKEVESIISTTFLVKHGFHASKKE